jgi:hypothetical protein
MKLSLRYLDTCLPDYFQGFGGVVFAVPLPTRPRNGDVFKALNDEIKAWDCTELQSHVEGPAAGLVCGLLDGAAYHQLYESAREMFADEDMRKRWSTQADDLSESYAYFGIVIEDPDTPVVAHLYAKKQHHPNCWRLYWSVPGSNTCVSADGETCYVMYKTMRSAVRAGEVLHKETAKRADW